MAGRRKLLLALAGAGAAGGAVAAYRAKHALPPRSEAAEERFRKLQEALRAANHLPGTARFVEVRDPPLRVQVIEAGTATRWCWSTEAEASPPAGCLWLTRLHPRTLLYSTALRPATDAAGVRANLTRARLVRHASSGESTTPSVLPRSARRWRP